MGEEPPPTKFYSLKAIEQVVGVGERSLRSKIRGPGGKVGWGSGDKAVTLEAISKNFSFDRQMLGVIEKRCEWGKIDRAIEVSVVKRPFNKRLLLCADYKGNPIHVLLKWNGVYAKGMKLWVEPHDVQKAFYRVVGPTPRFSGDHSYRGRLRDWAQKR
jgi:hypothetical protein